VEIASIFISFQSRSDFAPLLPYKKFGLRDSTENSDDQSSEGGFGRRKRMGLLDPVKKIDDNLAVRFLLSDPRDLFSPISESTSCFFKLSG
jgi:hypothetical protein